MTPTSAQVAAAHTDAVLAAANSPPQLFPSIVPTDPARGKVGTAPAQITNATTGDGYLSAVLPTPLDSTHGCQINHSCLVRHGTALVASGITCGANGSLAIQGKGTLTLGALQATQSVLRMASVTYVERSSGSGNTSLDLPKGLANG